MESSKSFKTILKNTFWCIKLIAKLNPLLITGIGTFQLLASTTPFFRNLLLAKLIDSLVYQAGQNWILYFTVFMIFMGLSSVFAFLQSELGHVIDVKLQAQSRELFIQKVTSLDYQHFENKDTGNLISKVDGEFGWRIRQVVRDVGNIFANVVSLAAVTAIILPKYPLLWLIIFVSQIPQYFIEKHWAQKGWEIYEKNSEKNKTMWDLNYQLRTKNYISELKVNNAINFLFNKFKNILSFFSDENIKISKKGAPSELGLILFTTIIFAICLGTLLIDTKAGIITIGLFTFYFQSITQTNDFFRGLVYSFVAITENSYHIGNYKKVMELKNIVLGGNKKIVSEKPPEIKFVDVSFRYPGSKKFVFENLNLTIKKGEEIAIVGANGAGKSTLIKLICHFYEPIKGRILVDGIDLRETDTASWYEKLSYLAQEFNLYPELTLRENVAIGHPEKNDDGEIKKALSLADASFYKKYSKGLDTLMSQRYGGEEPSWGQMQKIAIARVFYRNSPIVILDEPTASIDAVSEYKIFTRLYRKILGKTLIIVSHRFSTVRNAKRIIVLDKGKIVEQGSHEELLRLKGFYAKSFHLQAKGYN